MTTESTTRTPLVMLADAAMATERVRLAAQVRLSHLALRGQDCPDTRQLLERAKVLEDWVDGRLAAVVKEHPAAPWFTRVKGTGGEAIGKVVGHIEAFGHYYALGDPCIPFYVERQPVMLSESPKPCQRCSYIAQTAPDGIYPAIWVEGIERFTTPSKLRVYAGLAPGQHRSAGTKLAYNAELRMLLWRLGGQLLKASGKYYEFYLAYRHHLEQRLAGEGIRIVPTPKGRYCAACDTDVVLKAGHYCPKCGNELSLKTEPPGVKWQGHVHLMCQRRMIQMFLDHLWVVWREALGLPLRTPYPVEYMGHSTVLTPEMFCDRP